MNLSQNCEVDGVTAFGGGSVEIYSMYQISNLSVLNASANTGNYCGFTSTVIGSSGNLRGSNFCEYEDFLIGECASVSIYYTCGITGVSVGSGGYLYLSQNCSAVNLNLSAGASALIRQSCRVNCVSIASGAELTASYYTELDGVQIADGGRVLLGGSQCRMSGVTVEAGGYLSLADGASALAVTSSAGAVVEAADGAYIEYSTTEESNE